METVTFKTHVYTDIITQTAYGEHLEIQKRKAKNDYYNYRIGLQGWGKYLTLKQLNDKLKHHGVKVENVRA